MRPNFSFPPLKIHTMDKLLVPWLVLGLLSFVVPLIVMGGARASLRRQQQYEDGGQDDGQGDDQQQYNGNYSGCRWWQWHCSRNNNYNNNNQNGEQNDERTTPWWWFGATEEQRRDREEQGYHPALTFTYVWSLLLFCGILYFGYREVRNGSDLYRVAATLAVYANLCLATMVLVGGLEGGVQTEGRELEEQGFYAQFAVMMFLTNLFCMIFSMAFAVVFYLRARRSGTTKIDVDETDYRIHQPEVKVVDKERMELEIPELCGPTKQSSFV